MDATLQEAAGARVASDRSPERQSGVPVTQRDVAVWLRSVDGVARVLRVQLRAADRRRIDEVKVRPTGLPRYTADRDAHHCAAVGGGKARHEPSRFAPTGSRRRRNGTRACRCRSIPRGLQGGGAYRSVRAAVRSHRCAHESAGAFAPVVTRAGEILWRDDRTGCHRLPRGRG